VIPSAPLDWRIESRLPGVHWPTMPDAAASQVLALLFQMERTQRLAPQELQALQLQQLTIELAHAVNTVPYYRERLAPFWSPQTALTWETFHRFPLLTRRHLQDHHADLISSAPPVQHGGASLMHTSGSTGAPVSVLRTALDGLFWKAFTLREHVWHRRDLGAKLSAIRQGVSEDESDNWGAATEGIIRTGPASTLPVSRDIETQVRWIERQQPAYLLSHPSNLAALAEHCIEQGIRMPYLREARTRGEALPADLHALCREAWGIPVVDMYLSNECGYIALQCPQTSHYHVMAESLLVEVIDDEGRACAPGQTGRIVVSTLHNFAMPLIRYEIGDLAEVGAPCSCGRGLPVMTRILGRQRNMLRLADGKRFWPSFGLRGLSRELGIRQHQLVQKSFDRIEARLVVDVPLDAAQEERLRKQLLSCVPAGFEVAFSYCAEIPRSAGGKYEDFISEVDALRH
jgi:phenylacetate-CoA ligase